MRFAPITSLVLCAVLTESGQVVDRRPASHQSPQLELRLSVEKSSIRPGERLSLRVELWNVGGEDVIVAQNLSSSFGNSSLNFVLSSDHVLQSSSHIGDNLPDRTEPDFEHTFVTNWLTLNKNHFFGTYVYMDPVDFSYLRKPGWYTIHALYFSRGISSTPGWNGSFLKQADIDKLPLAPFQGTLTSNEVGIKITASTQSRRSPSNWKVSK